MDSIIAALTRITDENERTLIQKAFIARLKFEGLNVPEYEETSEGRKPLPILRQIRTALIERKPANTKTNFSEIVAPQINQDQLHAPARIVMKPVVQPDIDEIPPLNTAGSLFVKQNKPFIIGRRRHTDMQISDPKVSENHLMLELDSDENLILKDLRSSNGTIILFGPKPNNERHIYKKTDRLVIPVGAIILVGDTYIIYEGIEDATACVTEISRHHQTLSAELIEQRFYARYLHRVKGFGIPVEERYDKNNIEKDPIERIVNALKNGQRGYIDIMLAQFAEDKISIPAHNPTDHESKLSTIEKILRNPQPISIPQEKNIIRFGRWLQNLFT